MTEIPETAKVVIDGLIIFYAAILGFLILLIAGSPIWNWLLGQGFRYYW